MDIAIYMKTKMFVRVIDHNIQFMDFDEVVSICCLNAKAAFADVYHSFVWIF